MVVNSIEELNKAISTIIKGAMTPNGKIFEAVRKCYLEHIEKDVYDSYSPIAYDRRGSSGGLADPRNIVGETLVDGTLEVRNIAKPSSSVIGTPYNPPFDTAFALWIEEGLAYSGNAVYLFSNDMSGETWANPRRFTENTINDLKNGSQIETALREALMGSGIEVY